MGWWFAWDYRPISLIPPESYLSATYTGPVPIVVFKYELQSATPDLVGKEVAVGELERDNVWVHLGLTNDSSETVVMRACCCHQLSDVDKGYD